MSNQGRESWSRCSPGPPPPQVNFAGAADVASGPRRGSGGQGCASVPAIAALLWFQAACDLQGQAGCRRGNCLCLWGLPRPPRGRRGWCQQRGYTGPGNSLPQRHGVRRGLQMGLWGCAFGCRPPGGEGRCTCRRGPCVTLGSCSCCGFWCWQWVALSTSSGLGESEPWGARASRCRRGGGGQPAALRATPGLGEPGLVLWFSHLLRVFPVVAPGSPFLRFLAPLVAGLGGSGRRAGSCGTDLLASPLCSRRVCAIGAPRGPESESFVQRVYQPFLTTCDGHRACSTYRTIYRTAYRHSSGPASPRPRYACCPGWKRTSGHPMACGAAICQPPCQNGGSCVQPGRCHCPAGWQGNTCQTDVDECSAGGSSCPQCCVNTAGSYWCQCREGHNPSTDGVLCLPERGTPRVAPNPTAGVDTAVEEEVQRLRSRVDVLEQKLQLVLAPLHSMASRALEHGLPDPSSLLTHSFQQLDRIDSLSEQISFLEEQLGSCSCKKQP
uniref:Epidermal growth factor-like protein 7 n=2 Tax=Canis lupus familiaris TaxID=9615 RepID=A0A8C0SP98_CANLF